MKKKNILITGSEGLLGKSFRKFMQNKSKNIFCIDLKNISLTYKSSHNASVSGVTLSIAHGTTTGIMGESGAGKSTLVDIILGLIKPSEGEVLVDGKNINSNVKGWQSLIGYVPQDVFLFSDTIQNNIAFGLDENEYTFSQIEKAAKKAGIFTEIEKFPEKFNTKVGERGVTLSGGQKQRIAIARALIREPQVLIFDDCLSAVDTETSNTIQKNMTQTNKKQLSVHISHRVNHLSHCDFILVIDNGEIVAEGKHQDLIKKEGFYKEIFKKQQLEEN